MDDDRGIGKQTDVLGGGHPRIHAIARLQLELQTLPSSRSAVTPFLLRTASSSFPKTPSKLRFGLLT